MSLRMRLILSYSLVAIICLSIVAVAVVLMLQGSRDRYAMDRLDDMTRPIYVQVTALAKGEAAWAQVMSNLEDQAKKNNVYILLGNSAGNIVNQVSPLENMKQPIKLEPGELPHGITEPTHGTFTTTTDQTFLYAAYPIQRLFSTQQTARLETLVLSMPRGDIMSIWAGLATPLLRIGFISLGISVVIAIIMARSVYRSIQHVTVAVDKMAKGQYDHEIPISGPREIKTLAIQFNEMVSKVKQSQQQLRHFVADVSHQLRTPLTAIQGFAQAILDGTADNEETRLKAARVIDDESKRMIRQVDEILELSRMQSGQLQMARELVDVKEVLMHCHEIFNLRAEDNGVSLQADIEPLMPVVGDADRLEQVISNLLDNALKNIPAQGKVRISGKNRDNSSIEIEISDNGPGIPPEQLPYVFERFYQASGLRAGFGLGLAIAKEIILAHGGKIEAVSEPGEGTRFIIVLSASVSRTPD